MFKDTKAFSSFSTPDLAKAREFYGRTLGLDVRQTNEGLELHLAGGSTVFIYPSSDYTAPEHTVLNFVVDDIDQAIDWLAKRGVRMEHYDKEDIKTDERGIPPRRERPGSGRVVQGSRGARAVGDPGALIG